MMCRLMPLSAVDADVDNALQNCKVDCVVFFFQIQITKTKSLISYMKMILSDIYINPAHANFFRVHYLSAQS